MSVDRVEFLVEEPSMEAALERLLPKLLGNVDFSIHPHQCKQELLMRLPERLRGYAAWLPSNWRIVVVVDRDNDRCEELKARLEQIAASARLPMRSTTDRLSHPVVANRIVVEELEAWFFGDWAAVRAAYPRVSVAVPSQAKYRNPDAIRGGTWEAFERVLKQGGYFRTGLRKVEAAGKVAEHMDPVRNTSPSFGCFRDAVLQMTRR